MLEVSLELEGEAGRYATYIITSQMEHDIV